MIAAFGLVLAVVCIAIVATGFALAVVSWQPHVRRVPHPAAIAAFTVGAGCFLLAALHQLALLLT